MYCLILDHVSKAPNNLEHLLMVLDGTNFFIRWHKICVFCRVSWFYSGM